MYKHILLPTDGSTLSARAVASGIALARALGAGITALFVAPPPTPVVFRRKLPIGYATTEQHADMIERERREGARRRREGGEGGRRGGSPREGA